MYSDSISTPSTGAHPEEIQHPGLRGSGMTDDVTELTQGAIDIVMR
jgi:hypothetical protein